MNCHLFRPLAAAVLIAAIAPLGAGEKETAAEGRLHASLVRYVDPVYPVALRFGGVTSGFAMVWITVGPSGSLTDAYATEFSHKRFADAALAAIREWQFAPDSSGSTLPRLFSIRFDFSLDGLVVVEFHASDDLESRISIGANEPEFASFSFEDLDSIPDAIVAPLPAYPEVLKPERKSGKVEILYHVDQSGRVRVPMVTYSDDPRFAEAALDAISKWSFAVPRRDGRPSSAYALHRFTFGPRSGSNG
jgi:TonB family protein